MTHNNLWGELKALCSMCFSIVIFFDVCALPFLCRLLCACDTSEEKYKSDMQGLADIDAHSYRMATSIHYDLSDLIEGPLIRKKY